MGKSKTQKEYKQTKRTLEKILSLISNTMNTNFQKIVRYHFLSLAKIKNPIERLIISNAGKCVGKWALLYTASRNVNSNSIFWRVI